MSKNKQQKSIVLPIVLMTSLLFVLLFGGWQLAASGFKDIAPIKNVEIEGSFENISLNNIREKVMSVLEGGYFTVDLEIVRNALQEMPWVEDASIRRQWPSGIHIKVLEKQAVAYWGDNALLSDRGELFIPNKIKRDKLLPKLNGPAGLHHKVLDFLVSIRNEFSEINVDVKQLKLDERRAWTLTLDNKGAKEDVVVKLGRENTVNRIDRFVSVFSNNSALDLNNIAVIDMRYPNGFSIRKNEMDVKLSANTNAGFAREV